MRESHTSLRRDAAETSPQQSVATTEKTVFRPVDPRLDFPHLEENTLVWWRERDMMQQYVRKNAGARRRFSFLDGPITANNPMGVHHAWGRTYKDVFQRFKTMQGFEQRYQNGFDSQGLHGEVEVEKELGRNNKRDIETYGIARFVECCKQRALTYAAVQTEQSIRLGYWMDWDNSYYTMSNENNYTIWLFLKRCHEHGWIYKGHDVMPWCPRCGTGLTQAELADEYRDVVHPSAFVALPLLQPRAPAQERDALLVWTTTPWTLAANVAACTACRSCARTPASTSPTTSRPPTRQVAASPPRSSKVDGDEATVGVEGVG